MRWRVGEAALDGAVEQVL